MYDNAMKKNHTQTQVSHMFNAISKRYDRVNRIVSFGIDQKWRKTVASHLPEKENLRLLDLATGTCDQLIALLETEKVSAAVGIDLAEEMLAIGLEKLSHTPYAEKVELKVASASEIPFSDNTFDCVTISFGIRNVQGNCLREIYRALAFGGKAMILEFSLPKNRLIRSLHLFYLRKMLPLIGGWMTKEKEAYCYLNQTIEAYPYGKNFLQLMEKEGFVDCKAIPLTLGVATLYIGEKP